MTLLKFIRQRLYQVRWFVKYSTLYFSTIHGENNFHSMRWIIIKMLLCWIFISTSSLKQQSTSRHAAPRRHIILILSQQICNLTPYFCMLSWEATNTNFIVFVLTQPGSDPMIYYTRGEYTTDKILYIRS